VVHECSVGQPLKSGERTSIICYSRDGKNSFPTLREKQKHFKDGRQTGM